MSALAALLLAAAPFGPFETGAAPLTADAKAPPAAGTFRRPSENPFYFAFEVYRDSITVFDGARCRHRPTCAVYGMRAVEKHGVWGFFLTIDRLLRGMESSALRPLPIVVIEGEPYFLDPLSDSDFWMDAR